jgi:nucleotide-binding universal stress UspA family protein
MAKCGNPDHAGRGGLPWRVSGGERWEFVVTNVPDVRRLVVGVDGSAESVSALMWACREASLRDAEVLAVLAVEAGCHRVASYAAPRPAEIQGSWGLARDVLRRAVSQAASRFPGVRVRAEVAEGLAARVLLDLAAGADMLVLGRSFHGPDNHHGAGPVIRACLRAATCPVVVIGMAETLAEQDVLEAV